MFTGGHPPFATFPPAAGIAGAILIFPICILVSRNMEEASPRKRTL